MRMMLVGTVIAAGIGASMLGGAPRHAWAEETPAVVEKGANPQAAAPGAPREDEGEKADKAKPGGATDRQAGSKKEAAAHAESQPVPIHQREEIVRMWKANNALRASVGLPPHRLSPELTRAAQDHAEFMARTGVFSHYANGGYIARAARHGYRGSVRENIAMGYGSIEAAFAGWRSSGGHWASIVSNTQDAGFGYAVSSNGTPYYVGVYGSPAVEVAKPVVEDPDAGEGENRIPARTVSHSAQSAPPATTGTQTRPSTSYGRRPRRRGWFRRRR